MHRRRNKRKKLIIIFLCAVLCIMAVGYSAFSTNINITTKGNIKDKSRVIQSWNKNSNEDFHTDFYKQNIISATFLDSAVVPSNAVEKWDVSETEDQGVMAYVTESTTETGKYDLYIGAKKGVIANSDSSYLFYKFVGMKDINFNNNFDTSNTVNMAYMFGTEYEQTMNITKINFGNSFITSNVTNMSYMFFNNASLEELDVSGFDTSNVTTFARTFHGCSNVKILEVSNFNMSNVTSILDMFNGCRKLNNLNVSKWNTSNIKTFAYAFANLYNMEKLNLCSFNTKSATDMRGMFSWSSGLKEIYVSSNWSTANANTTDFFIGTSMSEVTTDQCNN